VGNTQKVQDIIDELKAQMLLESELKPTGNLLLSHSKKRSSVNPYLSGASGVAQQASAPNSKESSPKKPEAGQRKLL
jgi:hypothetical protein